MGEIEGFARRVVIWAKETDDGTGLSKYPAGAYVLPRELIGGQPE